MAVRLSCMIFLLEEAKRRDNVEKRRQAHVIRNMDLLTTDVDYIKVFRLTEELIKQLEEDISPFLAKTKRQGGICNRTKVPITTKSIINHYVVKKCLKLTLIPDFMHSRIFS